jgi:Rieske Fe-S protein
VDELAPGAGCVVTQDHHKVAAYRDDDGRLFLMSAVCPHLKCIVGFNAAERSWDCPCHGGRFSARGDALESPTLSGLEPLKPD